MAMIIQHPFYEKYSLLAMKSKKRKEGEGGGVNFI